MSAEISRRSFVKGSVLASAGAALGLGATGCRTPRQPSASAKAAAPTPVSQNTLPTGRIGRLEVSRLLLGGNLLTHYTHSRDLRYVYTLAAHYNTDDKILQTLALAETHGVNTLVIHTVPHALGLLRRHRRERGGRMQWIICPTADIKPDLDDYRRQVEDLLKDGCEAIYLWGVRADALTAEKKFDLMARAVEVPREFGVPSGVGAHALDVIKASEEHGVRADFYVKTFHHHSYTTAPKPEQLTAPYNEFPGYWCQDPKATAEFMKAVKKPWIAFKTMAAGAIPPKQAFRYAFQNGADFVLAGMFDFEIAEDAKLAKETMAGLEQRARPWIA